MKRPFRGFEVVGLVAALAGGAACTPSNSVKSGAPVLIEVTIVKAGRHDHHASPPAPQPVPGTASGGACRMAATMDPPT